MCKDNEETKNKLAGLTIAYINVIEFELLDDIELYGRTPEDAQTIANYIAGIHDMAVAMRRAIREGDSQ